MPAVLLICFTVCALNLCADCSIAAEQRDPAIAWWFDLNAPSFGSSAVGDIDGDGRPEIVFGTYFNDEHIYALNAENGTMLWSFFTNGCNDASPLIYDVDLDNQLEVVVPASSPYTVYCLNGLSGSVEWSTSTGYPNCIDSPPAAADLDNDGRPEIVFGTFYGKVFCLNGEDGSIAWQANLGANSYIQSCPNILDCDGDGQLDVVVAQWQGDCRVYALRGNNGSVLWFSEAPEDWMYHGGSFADIDEDGRPEIVIGCYDGDVYVFNAEDGSLLWEYPGVLYVGAPTSIADLNNDGHMEIALVSYTTLKVLSHTGSLLWTYGLGGSAFRGAAIADMNNDNVLDLVIGSDDGNIRVISGDNGHLIWSYNLENHYGNTFDIDNAPVIADFDGDDSLDVFLVGGYGSSSQPQNNHGRGYAISGFAGAGPGWLMFRHDERHSACFTRAQYNIDLQLIPASLPIQIPANGGSFNYLIGLTNNDPGAAIVAVWITATLPSGGVTGPIIGPVSINMNPGASIIRSRSQSIPAGAPPGQYTYNAYAGTYPSIIFDEEHFPFEKLTTGEGGGYVCDWLCWGDDFYSPEADSRENTLPHSLSLSAFPNPFNPTVNLQFYLHQSAYVELKIFNLRGQLLEIPLQSWKEAGNHLVRFSAESLPAGVYFAFLKSGDLTETQKLLLIK